MDLFMRRIFLFLCLLLQIPFSAYACNQPDKSIGKELYPSENTIWFFVKMESPETIRQIYEDKLPYYPGTKKRRDYLADLLKSGWISEQIINKKYANYCTGPIINGKSKMKCKHQLDFIHLQMEDNLLDINSSDKWRQWWRFSPGFVYLKNSSGEIGVYSLGRTAGEMVSKSGGLKLIEDDKGNITDVKYCGGGYYTDYDKNMRLRYDVRIEPKKLVTWTDDTYPDERRRIPGALLALNERFNIPNTKPISAVTIILIRQDLSEYDLYDKDNNF